MEPETEIQRRISGNQYIKPLSGDEIARLRSIIMQKADTTDNALNSLSEEGKSIAESNAKLLAFCRIYAVLREMEITPDSAAFVAKALLWHTRGKVKTKAVVEEEDDE